MRNTFRFRYIVDYLKVFSYLGHRVRLDDFIQPFINVVELEEEVEKEVGYPARAL